MPRISTDNYDTVASWNGSQDLFVVEQPDGTKVATPAMVKQYVLGNSIDDIYSVMGQNGAKNLIPYPYASNSYSQRDIDFTCLSDGTINANGTNDGTGNSTYNFVSFTLSKGSYVINGCPTQTGTNYRCGVVRSSDSVTLASDLGSGAKFTLDADTVVKTFVQVYSGKTANNIIFKPMIRLAADTDNTYQPYAKTNKQLTDDKAEVVSVRDYVNEFGVKNLLVPKWTETQTTENGVTYTFNADGTIIMNTDENGATANTNCNLRQNTVITNNVFPAGTYTLTACPAGGSSTTYRTWARAYRPGTTTALTSNLYDEGNGVSFTVSEPFSLGLNVTVMRGYVCNNLTWKPMLRIASDINDDTYQPYAKTNRQLTEVIGDLSQTGLTGDSVAEQLTIAKNQIAARTECFISSSNGAAQSIKIGAIAENRIFLFACGFHTNYVLELIAISSNGANVVHVPVANSSINSISNISYDANSGVMSITVQSNPFGYGRMTRLS